MKIPIFCVLAMTFFQSIQAQDLKAEASKEIDREDFAKAVALLQRVVETDPNDADAWYQLGHSLHWLCYDSTPVSAYDRSMSDRILECMHKALALNPHLRNCYSVIGSECGARAEIQLQSGNWSNFLQELKNAKEEGAFPDWLLEYGRNLLKSSGPNAILFTGGDAEVFPVWYCQFVENMRTDVTLAPVALLDRPWFLLLLKSGVPGSIESVPIPWTREQIMDIHLSKWTTRSLDLPIAEDVRQRYAIADTVFVWSLKPDLHRDERTLLSVNKTVIMGIVCSNRWNRPIQFSLGCHPWMLAGLDDHLRLSAISYELVPFEVQQAKTDINSEPTCSFLTNKDNFQGLKTLPETDIPYISAPLNNYRLVYLRTCDMLIRKQDFNIAREIFNSMEANLRPSFLPIPEGWNNEIQRIQDAIHASKP